MTLFIVSFLAGVLTIVSPCILPILPFVFSRAGQPFARSTLPMLLGMALTFAGAASLAALGGSWAVHANEVGRLAAIVLLAAFGLTLVSTRLAAIVSQPVVALGSRLSRKAQAEGPSIGGSLLLGAATGLLWAPCAGPILGLVLTGAALNGANAHTTLLLAAYAAGAATSLALAVAAGGKIFAAMKHSLGFGEKLRKAAGVAVLAGVAAIGLGLDTGALARLSSSGTTNIEQTLLNTFENGGSLSGANATELSSSPVGDTQSRLPVEGRAPPLDGAVTWLNSTPLTAESLRGKVVLVDFWTYSCINCIRTVPYIKAWAERYKDKGLVVIGVHSPEFAFEKQISNVERAIGNFGITYPVAIDNDFEIWRAFSNNYWPAIYVIDAQGQIRYHQFGEGNYEQSKTVIQDLLAEAAGSRSESTAPVVVTADGAYAAPDLSDLRSGETYLGYLKASGLASPERLARDSARNYTPGNPDSNQWGLAGNWTVGAEAAVLNDAGGSVTYRFSARDLHLVLGAGATGRPIRYQVTVDGEKPGPDHGADTDADGYGTVTDTRLYQLVRQSGAVRERNFAIRFLDPGVEAYAFTFG